MSGDTAAFDDFIALSTEVTGFSAFALHGTGQARAYFDTVTGVVGDARVAELGKRWRGILAGCTEADEREAELRRRILGDPELGPIARNLIKLWYVGTWYQLPTAWRETYGALDRDTTFVVSASAYPEGLLWPAIGSTPFGAKGPGYGTWAAPPSIPEV